MGPNYVVTIIVLGVVAAIFSIRLQSKLDLNRRRSQPEAEKLRRATSFCLSLATTLGMLSIFRASLLALNMNTPQAQETQGILVAELIFLVGLALASGYKGASFQRRLKQSDAA